MARDTWSTGVGVAYPQDLRPQLDDLPSLSLSADLDDLFQGAPPLPRLDGSSNGFDHLLQRWLQTSSTPLSTSLQQPSSQEYSGYNQLPLSAPYQPEQQEPVQASRDIYSLPGASQGGYPQHNIAFQDNEALHAAQTSVSQAPANHLRHAQVYHSSPYETAPQPHSVYGAVAADLPRHDSPQLSSGTSFNTMRPSTPAGAGAQVMPSISGAAARGQEFSGELSHSDNEQLNCYQPTASMTMGPDGSVDDAKKAWTKPRRRGPMSEESKEKERARNRRAQKKFREREKERQGQRQNAMATLEAHIASLAKEKADLEARNALLEQAATLRLKQERIDSTPGYMDGEFFVEVTHQEPIDLAPTLSVRGQAQKLSMPNLAKLTFKQHAGIYKEYVDVLQQQLEVQPSQEQTERIIQLVHELCALNLATAVANPRQYSQFQLSRLDLEEPQAIQTPRSVWVRCLEKLQLTEDQRRQLLADRRLFFTQLGPILQQRWELHNLVETTLRGDSAHPMESHVNAMEAVEKLRDNLREEQVLLVQSMCTIHQQLLYPHQTAANIVYAYPYLPDVPMIVDIIASQTPGEPSTAELLGVHKLPPSSINDPY